MFRASKTVPDIFSEGQHKKGLKFNLSSACFQVLTMFELLELHVSGSTISLESTMEKNSSLPRE
jgi:hypothetical protein